MKDDEIVAFDHGYRLGFRAGQLNWRKQMIDGKCYIEASHGGAQIAIFRGNISLDEYAQSVEVCAEGGI